MRRHQLVHAVLLSACVVALASETLAQTVETVGSRALGMGGAFVAVASDSTATWWNPAGLATAPFFDAELAWAGVEQSSGLPASREEKTWFAAAMPALGFGYYRFQITDIQPIASTGGGDPGRQEGGAGVPVRSLSASQLGVTVLHTLITGVHIGTTVKYVRGTLRSGRDDAFASADDSLETGEELEGGDAQHTVDLDVGVLAVVGAFRMGAVVRNVREPGFEAEMDGEQVEMHVPRQFRVGAAFHPEAVGGPPLTVALDADVVAYQTGTGDRRVVAIGAEQWLFGARVAVRGGGRVNTTGDHARSATAGISVTVRPGLFVVGNVVRGGSADEQGWGLGARVSF